jgi:hypothetical protein
MDEIGASDDADDFASAYHGQALNPTFLHQAHDFIERYVFGDRHSIRRHDLVNLASMGTRIFLGESTGSQQELEPSRPSTPRSSFDPPEEIAFRYDSALHRK